MGWINWISAGFSDKRKIKVLEKSSIVNQKIENDKWNFSAQLMINRVRSEEQKDDLTNKYTRSLNQTPICNL